MVPLNKNFDFNLRKDHYRNSYERRDYESVDEKRPILGYVPKNDEKIVQDEKGLTCSSFTDIHSCYRLIFTND